MEFFNFQVMIQPHNRGMSLSIYISAVAVADTITLSIGNLNTNHFSSKCK